MKKVVINTCYGGFSLSYKAVLLYFKLLGKPIYAFIQPNFDGKYEPYNPTLHKNRVIHYSINPTLNEKGGINNKDYTYSEDIITRDDPILIKVVEQLKEQASGECSKLKIVEIPDYVDYIIEEYDGYEHIAEKHRTWG